MLDEIDIYRSAMVFIKKYGENAKHEAAAQALSQVDHLDAEGLAVWCRIVSAIEKMQSEVHSCLN